MIRTSPSVGQRYEALKVFVRHLKEQSIRHRDTTTKAKPVVDELLPLLKGAYARLDPPSAAMIEFAKQQEADTTYDLAVAVSDLRNSVLNCINWIVANVSVDSVSGTLNERVIKADGSVVNAEVDPVKIDDAKAQIQVVIDLIE